MGKAQKINQQWASSVHVQAVSNTEKINLSPMDISLDPREREDQVTMMRLTTQEKKDDNDFIDVMMALNDDCC